MKKTPQGQRLKDSGKQRRAAPAAKRARQQVEAQTPSSPQRKDNDPASRASKAARLIALVHQRKAEELEAAAVLDEVDQLECYINKNDPPPAETFAEYERRERIIARKIKLRERLSELTGGSYTTAAEDDIEAKARGWCEVTDGAAVLRRAVTPEPTAWFRSPADKPVHLALTSGHTFVVGPKPIEVPLRFHSLARKNGCVDADEQEAEMREPEQRAESEQAGRHADSISRQQVISEEKNKGGAGNKGLTDKQIGDAQALRDQGRTVKETAAELGHPKHQVARWTRKCTRREKTPWPFNSDTRGGGSQ